mgnify:CR=1 FL=1
MNSASYFGYEHPVRGGASKTGIFIAIGTSLVVIAAIVVIVVMVKRGGKKKGDAAPQRSRLSIELTSEKQARDALAGGQPTMVFLYADWCGFCKKAMPVYDALAKETGHVKMMKLDAAKAKGLAKEKGVTGFPTFLTNWGEGKYVGYKPKDQMKVILDAAGNKGGARAAHGKKMMHSEAEAVEALQGASPVVVFVSSPSCGFCQKLAPLWEAAARSPARKAKMLKVDASEARNLVKQHGITGFPTMISNRGDKKYVGYRPREKLEEMLLAIET